MTTRTPAPSSALHFSRPRLVFWLGGIILFFIFLALIKSILLPFVVGILAAYFLDPAVRKLHAWKWSRATAAGVITVLFFLVAGTLLIIAVPLLVQQLGALIQSLPDVITGLQTQYASTIDRFFAQLEPDQVATIKRAMANVSGSLASSTGGVAASAVQSGLALLNLLLLIFLTPVVAFYLLRDWDRVVARIDTLLPRTHAAVIRKQLAAIDSTLSAFIRGQTNVCLLMATYYGILLPMTGLKFGVVIGIMTGLMMFIPFVGYITGFFFALTVALFQFNGTSGILMVIAIYAVGALLENGLVTPRLVGGKVGLHPLWIIFGMLTGAALFGFVGVLIAVPVTAILGVLVRFAIARYMESSLYSGKS